MTRCDDDRELRDLFASSRRDEAGAAPSFDATLAAAEARRRRLGPRLVSPRFALAAAAMLLVGVAGLDAAMPRDRAARSDAYGCPRLASWQAPTDSLLVLPGREVLGQVPDIHPEIPRYTLPNDQPIASPLDGG